MLLALSLLCNIRDVVCVFHLFLFSSGYQQLLAVGLIAAVAKCKKKLVEDCACSKNVHVVVVEAVSMQEGMIFCTSLFPPLSFVMLQHGS